MNKFAQYVAAVMFLSVLVVAQNYPSVELFGGYSYLNFQVPSTALTNATRLNLNGWDTSISVSLFHHIAAEGNLSGHYAGNCGGSGLNCSNFSFLTGARYTFANQGSRTSGFIHGLVGVDHAKAGFGILSASDNSLALGAGAGFDYWFRPQIGFQFGPIDYYFSRHFHDLDVPIQNNLVASVGIVFRFGGHSSPASSPERQLPSTSAQRKSGEDVSIPRLGLVVTQSRSGGALISDVAPGSAALAGLHAGDVINSVNGKPIQSPMELAAALSDVTPGAEVTIGFLVRGYWQSDAVLTVGQK